MDTSEQISPAKLIFALIGFLVIASVPLFISGPQLLSDRAVKQWRPAPELTVKSADCDVWYHLVSACEIEYVDVKAPNVMRPSLHYLVYGSWGQEQVVMMRAADDLGKVTASIALRDLSARTKTVVIYIGFIVLALFGFIKNTMVGSFADGAISAAAPPVRKLHGAAPDMDDSHDDAVIAQRLAGIESAPRAAFGRRRS